MRANPYHRLRLSAAATAVATLLLFVNSAQADDLKAGTAKIDITPPIGFPMWGYAARHDAPSVGVLDPLQARALVLTIGAEKIAIVSLDLGRAPPRQSMATIRQRVKNDTGIEHLFLVASHTHHGPVLETDNWPTPKDPYLRQLEKKIGDIIVEAHKNVRSARLGVASKEVPLNRNRHSKRADKPVDRELVVLRVEDLEGKPIAIAVNFAAHATMLDSKTFKFAPDYPGAMAALVERETGAACLFLQGAAGDLSPNPQGEPGPDKFGQALSREVLALARTVKVDKDEKPTLRVREDNFHFKSRIDLNNAVIKTAAGFAFFPAMVDFYEREYKDGVRPSLTTALLNNNIGIVGVSGEFFCGHSLSLKRRARLDHLLFLGYCNDYQQYFPTIEAASEGGYGTDPLISPAEIGAGEKVMDRALERLYQMRGRLPE